MKEEAGRLLVKAERSIAAASTLLRSGDTDFAASRVYYAMFYTAEALLAARELTFSKHAGVHAAFGKHFAMAGVLDARYHRWLLEAFATRIAGDYGVDPVIESVEVEEAIRRAKDFLSAARKQLHEESTGE